MAKKNYEEMSKQILECVGGKENITQLTHCVTRLRFNVRDKSVVKVNEIEKIKGVMGTQWSGEQFQIIIGGEVGDVYKVVCQLAGFQEEAVIDENLDVDLKKDHSIKGLFMILMDTLTSILAPIIPAIVACGLLQGVLYSVQSFGWLDPNGETYVFFFNCAQAAFYFLPVLIGYSAGKRFKCSPVLAATTSAILMLPAFSAMSGTSIKLFGIIPITYAGYSSTVIPAILTVYFQSYIEKICKKFVPKMIDIIVTPLVTVMVSAVVGWALLAPIGGWLGTFLAEAILWLYETLGPIGGAVCGAIYPFMLMSGMQVAMTPLIAQNLSTLGYDFLYPVTSAASNSAMAACALYIFFKSRKQDTKSLGLSTGVTALIGVTEPVLFGLITKYRKALLSTIIGGAVSGAIMALFKVKYLSFGFVPFGTIVLAVTDTFVYYMLGVIVAMVVTVIMMAVLKWGDDE
ncbi:PTS transporter subunit EIIC [uncultured Traorella sp.]|uniref:PTS transporter subunit EIIC n=1 Tax=uncultured Traorella sp. TaxID=1929048 RepID=UPI0025FC3740|nr:PTS transporter subunit EIIC [uncultured Traorella sp.]